MFTCILSFWISKFRCSLISSIGYLTIFNSWFISLCLFCGWYLGVIFSLVKSLILFPFFLLLSKGNLWILSFYVCFHKCLEFPEIVTSDVFMGIGKNMIWHIIFLAKIHILLLECCNHSVQYLFIEFLFWGMRRFVFFFINEGFIFVCLQFFVDPFNFYLLVSSFPFLPSLQTSSSPLDCIPFPQNLCLPWGPPLSLTLSKAQ